MRVMQRSRSQQYRGLRKLDGPVMGNVSTQLKIQEAFERAGIRFIDNDSSGGIGVRLEFRATKGTSKTSIILDGVSREQSIREETFSVFGFTGIPMAEHKRTLGGVDPEDNIAKTLVIDQQRREIRDYLARGRRFASLREDALNDHWIASYRGYLHNRNLQHERDYHDLSAEFELRKVVLPYGQVKHLFDANLAEVKMQLKSATSYSRELEEKIEELLALALASYSKSNDDEEPLRKVS